TSGMGLVLGGRARVILTGHANASWVEDLTTQRSSQGYTFSLGSGSVSWRSSRSSSVLSSSCEAEIYAGAMAAQELCWLTYLLTDLGEAPRSPPVLYVDNKAMLALCQEHRLEHITKHIALRYFLARELQQRGRLRLAYVATQANTADVFTKALQPCDHQPCFTFLTGLVTHCSPPLCIWGFIHSSHYSHIFDFSCRAATTVDAFLTSLPSEASAVRFVDFVTACLFFDADGDLGLGPGGGEPGSLRQTTPNTHDGLFPTGSTGWPTIPSCAAESAFAFDSNPPPRPPALALPPHPPAQPPRPPLAALRPHPPAQPPCPPAAALLSQNPAQPPRPPTAALLPHPPTQLLCLPAPRQPHRPSSPAARYASPARPPAPRVPLCAPPYTLSHLDVLMRPRCRARSTHRSSSSWSSIPSSSPPACSHCRPSHSPCAELASMYPPRSPPPPHSCTQPRRMAPPCLLPHVRHPLPLLLPPPPRPSFSKIV
ncbi:unnamed protein product, partial [Closterium sp. NIES-53]